jgi:hypothetical protein
MMVIFLVGLVSMILMRTLRKDYARYSKDEELDDMVCVPHLKDYIFNFLLVTLRCVSHLCTVKPVSRTSYSSECCPSIVSESEKGGNVVILVAVYEYGL